MIKPFDASQWIEWEYRRKEGDVSVFASTKAEAIETLKASGFININPKKMFKLNRLVSDVLKKDEIL
jgi:hypothetical protein